MTECRQVTLSSLKCPCNFQNHVSTCDRFLNNQIFTLFFLQLKMSKLISFLSAAETLPVYLFVVLIRREAAMQEGLKQAVAVPLALAERISILWPSLKEMVVYGNFSCKSDAQVLKNTNFYLFCLDSLKVMKCTFSIMVI